MDADNPFSPISEDNDSLHNSELIPKLQEENIFKVARLNIRKPFTSVIIFYMHGEYIVCVVASVGDIRI